MREHAAALDGTDACIVLSGEPPAVDEQPSFASLVRVVPGVGYDRPGCPPSDPRQIADGLRAAMHEAWGQPADVLHAHNVTLMKSSSLSGALGILRDEGIPVLVQVHDLAEDGRPDAYRREGAYPENCHYAVINSRDRRALLASGLLEEGLHTLFNPVSPPLPQATAGAPDRGPAGVLPRGEETVGCASCTLCAGSGGRTSARRCCSRFCWTRSCA